MNFILFNIIFMFIYYGLEFVAQKVKLINDGSMMENLTPMIILAIIAFILTMIIKKKLLDEYLNGN